MRKRKDREKDPSVNDRYLIFQKSSQKPYLGKNILGSFGQHTLNKYMPNLTNLTYQSMATAFLKLRHKNIM